jgi:CHAT domain-containing protein/Flp pilus assembly protein TadD
MKRLTKRVVLTLLLSAGLLTTSHVVFAAVDGAAQAIIEAEAAGESLAAGDLEAALEHMIAAHELDETNREYLETTATIAEQLGLADLSVTMHIKAIELAVSTQQKDKVAPLNAEISRLLSHEPEWVGENLQAASAISGEQQEGLLVWQEMSQVAEQALNSGDLAAALDTQESVLQIAQEVFGEEHWFTASSYRDLGYIYRQAGAAAEAEQFYSMALEIASNILAENHPQALEIQGLLAELYGAMGANEEAAMIYDLVASGYESSLGPASSAALDARLMLVELLESSGQFDEAAQLIDGLCEQVSTSYGTYHDVFIDCSRKHASVLSSQSKLDDAALVYQNVVALMSESFEHMNTGVLDVLTQLAEVYREQGRYPEAADLLSGIISTAYQMNALDSANAAKSYIARVFNNQGQYERAEIITREVLAYGQVHWRDEPLNILNTLLELGAITQRQGKLADAETIYQQAYEGLLEVAGSDYQSSIVALSNLAQVYEQQGLYDLAEPALKEALDQFEKIMGVEHFNSSRARNNLALLHESQGNFREAEPLYVKTLAIMEQMQGENHSDTIGVRNNLAFLYMLMQDYGQAEPLFESVYESWSQLFGEDHQNTLKAMNNLARVYQKVGNLEAAESMFLRAQALRSAALGEEHMDTLRSGIDLGGLYLQQERFEEADVLLTETLELLEKILGEQHPYTFEALEYLARAREAKGDLAAAVHLREKTFQRRSEFLDRMLWVTGENAREGYIRLHRPELDNYLGLLTRLDGNTAGKKEINASLQRKGLLLKITSEIQQIAQLSQDPKLSSRAQALEQARKELASLTLSGPTADTQGRHADVLYQLEQKVNELQGELGRASARYRSSIAHINADALESALPDNTVLVDFLTFMDGENRKLMAGIIGKQGDQVTYDLVVYDAMEDVEAAVLGYREFIQDEGADEDELLEAGQLAYDVVWEPLQELVGDIEHIYIVPDGILNILPFNAMIDEDEEYLINSRDFHILTSGRDLLPNEYKLSEGEYVIVAGPDYDSDKVVSSEELAMAQGRRSTAIKLGIRGGASGLRGLNFDPLPGAEREGRLITDQIAENQKSNEVYFKNEAQERVLSELDSPPEILHVATHGFFLKADDTLRKRLLKLQRGADLQVPPPGDNPLLRAGLAFAGINTNAQFLGDIDTVNDGVLTALEVLGLNLTGTKLVVLSACETGLGEIHEGEGVYGLRRSFQEAGVAEVISSLWEVSDAGTQALMTDFYRRLLAGQPAREALRETQLDMMESPEWGYPYVWSAFMIVGSYESAGYALQ